MAAMALGGLGMRITYIYGRDHIVGGTRWTFRAAAHQAAGRIRLTDGDYAYYARRTTWGAASDYWPVSDRDEHRRGWRLLWADLCVAHSIMIWLEGTAGRDPWPLVLRAVDTRLCSAVRARDTASLIP